jgi:hypothetical protein
MEKIDCCVSPKNPNTSTPIPTPAVCCLNLTVDCYICNIERCLDKVFDPCMKKRTIEEGNSELYMNAGEYSTELLGKSTIIEMLEKAENLTIHNNTHFGEEHNNNLGKEKFGR